MFHLGDHVLYASHGVCTVIAIETMKLGKTRGNYYCLQPVNQPDSRFYVPVDNEAALAKLRPLMSREALLELLHAEQVRQENWIPEDNLRKLRYRELISSGDRAAMLNMIFCIYRHKEALALEGKRLHQCDEGFLHDAQRLLSSEFSVAFSLKADQVGPFIRDELNCTDWT